MSWLIPPIIKLNALTGLTLLLLTMSFAYWFFEPKPAFVVLSVIPLIRNGLFLLKAYKANDRLMLHITILSGIFFILIAICAS